MQMREAKDAAAARTRAALQEIHASSALIAIGREVGIAKNAESCHRMPFGTCLTPRDVLSMHCSSAALLSAALLVSGTAGRRHCVPAALLNNMTREPRRGDH